MMDDEDEDPIIAEPDVFLSKQLSESLYLFQYPVRPSHMPYDKVPHLLTRMKPKQQKVEMELSMNTYCDNYETSKGEQIGVNVDGKESAADNFYKSGMMDKQVLLSAPVGVDPRRYAIGAFRNGELHLTPLAGIIQMRPNFSYLDRADERQHKRGPDRGGESSQDEEEEAPKFIAPKFAPKETEEAKARRMASYEFLRNQEEDEGWVDMRHRSLVDVVSCQERECLFADRSNPNPVSEFYMTDQEYLERLMPAELVEAKGKPAVPNNVLSLTDIKNFPVDVQVKALLESAKVMRFSQLMSLLPKNSEPTAVVRYVQQVALLVQGCWVIKSEILYQKERPGTNCEAICRARDYIMWRFTHHRCITRKELAPIIKLYGDDEKEILSHLAYRRARTRDWEFLMDYDQEFVSRHADVEQRQKHVWEQKFQQLSAVFQIKKSDTKTSTAAATSALVSSRQRKNSSRERRKSGEKSMSDHSDTDGETLKALKIDIQSKNVNQVMEEVKTNNKKRKVSFSIIDDDLDFINDVINKDPTDSFSALAYDQSNVDISEIGDDLLPLPVSKIKQESCVQETTSEELKQALVEFALDKLTARTVLTLAETKLQFQLRLAELPPGHLLGSGISDHQLEQALVQAGGLKLAIARSEPVFVLTRRGDSLDNVRSTLIELLSVKPSLMMRQLRSKLEEKGNTGLTDSDLKQVLKEYCSARSNSWYLKGSTPSGK